MLSDTNCLEFFEIGYLVLPGLFQPAELERMRGAFDRLERTARRLGRTTLHRGSQFVVDSAPPPAAGVRIQRIVWCGAAEPELLRFGRDDRLVGLARRLLGSDAMCHLINQAHFKLPGDEIEFPWHQDSTHRRYGGSEWRDVNGRGSYVQTVIAVDDVTPDNGPLEVIPGSCGLGHTALPEGRLPESLAGSRPVAVVMPAGSVLAFGPYTFHRSGPNHSRHPRRVLINGYAYPGANSRVYPGDGAGELIGWDPARRASSSTRD